METYRGHVRSPADAIKLFEACRLGLLPRVQRRLSEKERQSITSGSVFVWDEREAGMRRWTDGKSWSASRVSGSFLTYREMEGKRGGGNFVPPAARRVGGKTPDSGRGSDEDADMDGEGPDGYRYKPDGLMKQSFSITTSTGQHLHLISYFARPHAMGSELPQPTTDPALRHITPAKGMYPESTVHEQAQGPPVTRTPMQGAYVNSPHHGPPGPAPPPPGRGYPYQVPQGYNWPPSPMTTPPYSYQPSIYGPNPHYSPRQHHLPPSSGSPYPQQQTGYDRPPPLQDSPLPPSAARSSAPNSSQLPPSYAQNGSPRVAQARLVAEQQAQQAQRLQQSMPAPPMIDPRITASESTPASQTSVMQAPSQNIPSISSLVHAEDSTGNNTNGSSNTTSAEDKSASRHGSLSPKVNGDGQQNVEGGRPQDIPHAKLTPFGGEDMRALRVLDRKFCI